MSELTSPLSLLNILSLVIPNPQSPEFLQQRFSNEQKIINEIIPQNAKDMPSANLPIRVIPFMSIDHIQSLDEGHQIVLIHSTFMFTWLDERLMWVSANYGNIRQINRDNPTFNGKTIWTPSLHFSDVGGRENNILKTADTMQVSISSNGMVRIQVKTQLKISCFFEFGDFPNDYQNCTFSIYTPYDASEFQFSRWGGVEMVKYVLSEGAPVVDVEDFRLISTESEGVFLLFGKKIDKTLLRNARFARSFFRYKLIFKRINKYITSEISIPMICQSVFISLAGIARGVPGLMWLLICALYEVFNMLDLVEKLPPDYNEMPLIGQMMFFMLIETVFLITWRIFTIKASNTKEELLPFESKVDSNKQLEASLKKSPVNDIIHIGDIIISTVLVIQTVLNAVILW